ncbi:MAG: serine proteinase inhibitor [Ruminococcaceae bacterium]|jgi:serpin B|nr:serine proteinase inhibitor [Oscillospiraceae bacterium]
MKFGYLLILCLLLPVAMTMSSCAAPADAGKDLMADVKAAERPQNPTPPEQAYIDSVADFSWRLLQTSLDQSGNLLLSPASVYLALAMTLNGADHETQEAIKTALSSAGLSEDRINTASRDWITLLEKTQEKTELFITNSIWVRDAYPVHPDFLQRNADYFRVTFRSMDFSLPESVETINQWVRTATREKIDKIIDAIDRDVMMYLINAIYFKSDWKNPFAASATQKASFSAPGKPVDAMFMNQTARVSYLEGQGVRGVYLPYIDDSFAFFALLPDEKEDVRSMLRRLNSQTLTQLLTNRQNEKSINLSLPKFEVRYEDSLLDELSKLGMAVAFSGTADFSRMNREGVSDLLISEVKHKTFVRVDEKGSEAAAVTSVEMRLTSVIEGEETITFDRPFLFGILDTRTELPLFLGILEQPDS